MCDKDSGVDTPTITTSCRLRFCMQLSRRNFSSGPQAHHHHPAQPHPQWREETSQNGQFYRRNVFERFLGFSDVFRHGVLFQTAISASLPSYSNSTNHAVKKSPNQQNTQYMIRPRPSSKLLMLIHVVWATSFVQRTNHSAQRCETPS